MTDKVIQKALAIRARGGITLDGGLYRVPSASGNGEYTVSGHFCSCPATRLCAHLLSTVYLDALLAIQIMRYAETMDFLQAVVEEYSDRVEIMPAKIRALVKAEFIAAKKRVVPENIIIIQQPQSEQVYGAVQIS